MPEIDACSSFASTFTSSSVSLLVLRCRRSVWKSSSVSSRVFVRLPLCTSTMPYGRVHVERLRLFFAGGRALRRVAHVTQADVAEEAPHVARAERLAHLTLGLEEVEDPAALGRRDAGRVLPAMLQQQERVVDLLVDRALPDHSDDAAHGI